MIFFLIFIIFKDVYMYEIILVLIRNVTLNVNNATNNKEPLFLLFFSKNVLFIIIPFIFFIERKNDKRSKYGNYMNTRFESKRVFLYYYSEKEKMEFHGISCNSKCTINFVLRAVRQLALNGLIPRFENIVCEQVSKRYLQTHSSPSLRFIPRDWINSRSSLILIGATLPLCCGAKFIGTWLINFPPATWPVTTNIFPIIRKPAKEQMKIVSMNSAERQRSRNSSFPTRKRFLSVSKRYRVMNLRVERKGRRRNRFERIR